MKWEGSVTGISYVPGNHVASISMYTFYQARAEAKVGMLLSEYLAAPSQGRGMKVGWRRGMGMGMGYDLYHQARHILLDVCSLASTDNDGR